MATELKPLLASVTSVRQVSDEIVAELRRRFEVIQPSLDWKLPIQARIQDCEFDAYNEACIWFTGSALIRASVVSPGGFVTVACVGYYAAVGA